jgi:hypothetical protein
MNRHAIRGLAIGGAIILAGCGSSTTTSSATPTATPTPITTLAPTPTATPAPTLTPTPVPTQIPTPFPVAGHIVVMSLGINVAFTASCGDELSYVSSGNTLCYWNLTGPGGTGWYAFAGSITGPLAALSHARSGAIVTWTVGGTTHTRKLSGGRQIFPRDPATGEFGGGDVPPGQHVFLYVRDSTQEVQYDGGP